MTGERRSPPSPASHSLLPLLSLPLPGSPPPVSFSTPVNVLGVASLFNDKFFMFAGAGSPIRVTFHKSKEINIQEAKLIFAQSL